MAQPSTELITFRKRTTDLLDKLDGMYAALSIIEGTGANDTERQAFFQQYFTANPGGDITVNEFFAAVVALRGLKTWLETPANRVPLAKMRI